MDNQKQIKALEFVSCMEELALEKQMKQRILDRIRELKSSLQEELGELELGQRLLEVDELAIYMKQQFFSDKQKEIVVDDMTTVSIDEVRERVEQILQECHGANEAAKNSYVYNQQSLIREVAQKMRDMSNVKANYKEVQNARFFCEKFEQIGNYFNRQISSSMAQFTKTIFQNCDQATAKIRNMLAYIRDERLHKNQQELYYVYDTRRSQLLQQHTAEGDAEDYGGSLIGEFALKHVGEIGNIIEKQKKKTLLIKLLPLLVVLAFMIVPKVGNWIGEQIETIAESREETTNGFIESLADKALDKAFDTVEDPGIGALFFALFGLPIMILAAALYFVYIKIVNRTYTKKICTAVSAYLVPEIEAFLGEGSLYLRMEEAFVSQEEAFEVSYREIFEKLLSSENHEEMQTAGERERFLSLYTEWNAVKRLA